MLQYVLKKFKTEKNTYNVKKVIICVHIAVSLMIKICFFVNSTTQKLVALSNKFIVIYVIYSLFNH